MVSTAACICSISHTPTLGINIRPGVYLFMHPEIMCLGLATVQDNMLYASLTLVHVNGWCRFVGVIRLWEVESGRLLHSLQPLDLSGHVGDCEPSSGKGSEDRPNQTTTPQTYTDLLLCTGTHKKLVGITFDQNIVFYNLKDTSRIREVSSNQTHRNMSVGVLK